MKYSSFANPNKSHEHSLKTLNLMYGYDDFMESIGTVADLGCGDQLLDLEWWVTRATRDDNPIPLNIQGTAVDKDTPSRQIQNIVFSKHDLHTFNQTKRKFDILWCHDTFQYLAHPYQALKSWRDIADKDSMLVLILPQTVNIEYNVQEFNLQLGHCYHYTMTSLIYMLAVNGWDCAGGFFKKDPEDPWLHAIVYKSEHEPVEPGTSWYHLCEKGLLPETAANSVNKYGYVKQSDLVLPWLDKSLTWMGQQ
jgi:hypothetical protein